jgi:hypothetical protein
LAIAPPALTRPGIPDSIRHFEIRTETPDGNFIFAGRANNRGFLGTLIADSISAEDADDATMKVGRALAPTLSNLSMHLDIPLRIQQTEIIELQTGARDLIFQVPYNDAPLVFPPTTTLSNELMRYASCYREALGSNTPAFQFLCFFKILEALRKRSDRRASEAAGRGTCLFIVPERVPGIPQDFIPWLNSIFPVRPAWDDLDLKSIFSDEARGKKINRIVDTHLQPLRNAIAHAILDSDEGTLKAGDELETASKLSKWLPLTKCIVRRMLKVEFPNEFLREPPAES